MTYQDKAKQKAREKFNEIVPIGFPDTTKRAFEISEENLDTLISQTITDLLDEIEKEMGEEVSETHTNGRAILSAKLKANRRGHNTLHRKLTKKFNQIRM